MCILITEFLDMQSVTRLASFCQAAIRSSAVLPQLSSLTISRHSPLLTPVCSFHLGTVIRGVDYGKPPSYWHTSGIAPPQKPLWKYFKEPKNWPKYNEIVYPPQKPGDPPRPAVSVHCQPNFLHVFMISQLIVCK